MKKPFKNPFRHHRAKNRNKPRGYSPTQIICVSFVIVIALGTLLLSLPIASRYGRMRVIDAMFTATSATCVTGLVVRDTWTQFTVFGQAVILVLIQVGGLGLVTLTSFFALAMRRRMGFRDLRVLGESVSADGYDQAKSVLKIVVGLAAMFEGIGILLLMFAFVPQFGLEGVWISVFTAISAFCNAGFDIFGAIAPGQSLIEFNADPVVLLTLSALIIIGGLGFLVWENIARKRSLRKFSVYTKLVLLITAALLAVGWAGTCLLEWNNPETLGGMTVGEKLLNGFFQSATLRTAGFAAIDQAKLTESGKAFSSVLMFIGGSSGSTAGGIKTVTFLVLVLTIWARARGKSTVCAFKRTIPDEQTQNAMIIAFIVLALAVFGGIFISATSPMDFTDAVYEAVSALATVGLSAGGTASLSIPAQILIIIYMYFGRVGVLTISLGFLSGNRAEERFRYAETNLLIG